MISTIIFSKNRASQLCLLLDSIDKNLPELFNITIVYAASDRAFQKGYDLLSEKHDNIKWIRQENPPSDFREITLDLIDECGEYICFFVDDNIVYRKEKIDFDFIDGIFKFYEDVLICLSLRLGTNTVMQNEYCSLYDENEEIIGTTETPAPIPQECEIYDDKCVVWDWTVMPPSTNFAYPFSVDGHIFQKTTLLKMIDRDFDTPNTFEGLLMRRRPPFMSCFANSVVVNSPINIVGSSENKAGIKYGMSLEELNNRFLEGQSIDLDSMDFSNVRGCHQEIQYRFTGEVKC